MLIEDWRAEEIEDSESRWVAVRSFMTANVMKEDEMRDQARSFKKRKQRSGSAKKPSIAMKIETAN